MKRRNKGTPLGVKLFWYLAGFFLFIIVLLWVCQVVFMNDFYRVVTVSHMKRDAGRIETVLKNGGDPDSAVYDASMGSAVCVSVYEIKGGRGQIVSQAHIKNGCRVHEWSTGFLNDEYAKTRKAGGANLVEAYGEADEYFNGYLLYSVIARVDGADYFIVMDADAYLSDSTAATITVQLTMVTVILLIGAAIFAIVISRKITRPVSELSHKAEELAVGDYNIAPGDSDIEELNRLGDALAYAATELGDSARMKQELIANITHDLRTPLTMISGYSELMRDIPGEVTPENLQVIIDESARLSDLVSDVLEVSKAQSGGLPLNITRFCITDVVKKTTERYGEMLKNRGYVIEYQSDGTSVITAGDETKLIQAFCNLLGNAVNFTGESGRVIVRQIIVGDKCRIEVADEGSGIPAAELESIWDRYYRARDRHNKGVPGSGLGLTIVKNIMLAHDISFGVTSAVGRGSTFWFEVSII